MIAKTFRAPELKDALACVHNELGSDALVVSQQRKNTAGWWPFGRKEWEVVAVHQEEAGRDRNQPLDGYSLQSELEDIKHGLAQLARAANLTQLPDVSATLAEYHGKLCYQGVAPELAHEVIVEARSELSLSAQDQPQLIEAAISRAFVRRMRTRRPRAVSGSGPLVVFVVGQAGVGKTTTVAKLAAQKAREGRSVCIINADAERPAAGAQLEALGRSLRIDCETATDEYSLARVLERQQKRDIIFVDAAGYSHRDRSQLQHLSAMIETAPRRQVFLALSAPTLLEEMQQVIRAFRPLKLNGLVFCKLDETALVGPILTLACGTDIPVAYLTAGRRIPEDIETATPEVLGGLIFNSRPDAVVTPAPRKSRRPKRATQMEAVAALG